MGVGVLLFELVHCSKKCPEAHAINVVTIEADTDLKMSDGNMYAYVRVRAVYRPLASFTWTREYVFLSLSIKTLGESVQVSMVCMYI